MTLKQYSYIRIAFAVIIGVVFSQGIVRNNIIIPITTVIVAMTVLLLLRQRVKEVIADERDYQIAGKASRYALTIFSVIGSLLVVILFSLKDQSNQYEVIAATIAYLVCGLLLINSFFFYYFNQPDFWKQNKIKIIIWLCLFLIFVVAGLRLFSGEDNWLCINGQWVKHGQPNQPTPTIPCK